MHYVYVRGPARQHLRALTACLGVPQASVVEMALKTLSSAAVRAGAISETEARSIESDVLLETLGCQLRLPGGEGDVHSDD